MVEIFLIYDGILNSVFESQVLAPVKKRALLNPQNKYIILSFEPIILDVKNYSLLNSCLEIVQFKRSRFYGSASLYLSLIKFKKFLLKYKDQEVNIIARGPFAGWLVLKSKFDFKTSVIQARGLLCEEYLYANKSQHSFKKLLVKFRSQQFYSLERQVYSCDLFKNNICIESVTTNLQDYLCTTYGAEPNCFKIAQDDIPEILPESLRSEYKIEIRELLRVPQEASVYCYSGSAKLWQCTDKIIEYFESIYKTDSSAYFLILTPDVDFFRQTVRHKNFINNARILNVQSATIMKYLSASDYGVIFREDHIINRVARPTKILEYRAAGLKVISNFDY